MRVNYPLVPDEKRRPSACDESFIPKDGALRPLLPEDGRASRAGEDPSVPDNGGPQKAQKGGCCLQRSVTAVSGKQSGGATTVSQGTVCGHCRKTFSTKSILKQHTSEVHFKEKKFVCGH